MKSNEKRKGFTLVELLVVIAILAILATVTVVGFKGFTEKAKVSNDTTLVAQLNTVLEGEKKLSGPNTTLYDAVKDLDNAGFSLVKMTPTSTNNDIIWSQEHDSFLLVDENRNILFSDSQTYDLSEENLYNFWKIYDAIPEVGEQTFSMGVKNSVESPINTVDSVVGVDALGDRKLSTVNFTGEKSTIINLNTSSAGTLTINNVNADVDCYGVFGYINVLNSSKNSVNVYGEVMHTITLKNGKVNIQKGANIGTYEQKKDGIFLDGGSQSMLVVNDGSIVYDIYGSSSDALNNVTNNSKDIVVSDVPTNETGKTYFAGGLGTVESPYLVTTAKQFRAINNLKTSEERVYVRIENDINLGSTYGELNTYNVYLSNLVNVVLDGNNKTITNGMSKKTYIFGLVKDSEIKNLKIANINLSVIYKSTGTNTYNNVDIISGNVDFGSAGVKISKNESIFSVIAEASTQELIDCDINANLTAGNESYNAVFFGHCGGTGGNNFTFTNCTYSGNLTAGRATLFAANNMVNNEKNQVSFTITNFINKGVVTATDVNDGSYQATKNTPTQYNPIMAIFNAESVISATVDGEVYDNSTIQNVSITCSGNGAFKDSTAQ